MASPSWPFPRRVFPHVVWVAAEAVHEQESVATRDMLVQAIIGAGFGGGTEDFLHSAEELLGHLNVNRRSSAAQPAPLPGAHGGVALVALPSASVPTCRAGGS